MSSNFCISAAGVIEGGVLRGAGKAECHGAGVGLVVVILFVCSIFDSAELICEDW